ncbi:MAG: ATP-binding protein [Bacteroidetes bacterium]|nr:ATP-binding protein [Bacteroidota bacterium]
MKDLSLHILDIAQNSISAGAGQVEITIEEQPSENLYSLSISDDGKGMDEEMRNKVTDPFFTTRTSRKVGMGIPLLKLNAERTGGSFEIDSKKGNGTLIKATFVFNHIDRLPEGDLAGTIVMMASANPSIQFIYTHRTPAGKYTFDSREVQEVLGEIPISELSIYPYLKEMINENLKDIRIH